MKKVGKKKVSKKKVGKKVLRHRLSTDAVREIDRRFTYYPPDRERIKQHDRMRATMKYATAYVYRNTPDCREKSLALTKLEEAMFWANAAIARPKGEN